MQGLVLTLGAGWGDKHTWGSTRPVRTQVTGRTKVITKLTRPNDAK